MVDNTDKLVEGYAEEKKKSRRKIYAFASLITAVVLSYFTFMTNLAIDSQNELHDVAVDNQERGRDLENLTKAICEELLVHHRGRNEYAHTIDNYNDIVIAQHLGIPKADLKFLAPTDVLSPKLCQDAVAEAVEDVGMVASP